MDQVLLWRLNNRCLCAHEAAAGCREQPLLWISPFESDTAELLFSGPASNLLLTDRPPNSELLLARGAAQAASCHAPLGRKWMEYPVRVALTRNEWLDLANKSIRVEATAGIRATPKHSPVVLEGGGEKKNPKEKPPALRCQNVEGFFCSPCCSYSAT